MINKTAKMPPNKQFFCIHRSMLKHMLSRMSVRNVIVHYTRNKIWHLSIIVENQEQEIYLSTRRELDTPREFKFLMPAIKSAQLLVGKRDITIRFE